MELELPPFVAAAAPPSLFILLVAGHLLGDFAFQTGRMVELKHRGGVLGRHVAVVTVVHFAVLLPYASLGVVLACLGIGVAHAAIDMAKVMWIRRRGATLGPFLVDQAAHGAVLVIVFLMLSELGGLRTGRWDPDVLRAWQAVAVILAAFAFNANGGGAVVSGVLARLSPELEKEEDRSAGLQGSGRLIGILERTITLILILLGQWAAIVLLLAAKSIARFEELKERRFAEYYLVGTLTSILVAILVGLALALLLFGSMPMPTSGLPS